MTAASLLCDMGAPVAPVVGTHPVHQVYVGSQRVRCLRAIYTGAQPTFDDPGSFEFMAPLSIDVGGKRIPNPSVPALLAKEHVRIIRNGTRQICSGYIEKEPAYDLTGGWVRVVCKDSPADVDNVTIGHGSNSDPDPEDPEEDDDATFMLTGWGTYNAIVNTITSPWGPGVSVAQGPVVDMALTPEDLEAGIKEPRKAWSFGFQTIDVSGEDRLELEGLIWMEPGKSRAKVITLAQRFLDKPKKVFRTTVEIPDGVASGRWQVIPLPSFNAALEVSDGVDPGAARIARWNLALWRPVGSGAHRLAVRAKWVRKKDPEIDVDVPAVKVGAGAVDMVSRLMSMAAAKAGGWWFVVNHGGGLTFEDGAEIDPNDTGTFGSHISTFRPSTETVWDPSVDTQHVAAEGELGQTWPIRATVQGRAQVTAIDGAPRTKVRWTTVTGRSGESIRATTWDAGPSGGHDHDRVLSAPANVDFYAYANTVGPKGSERSQGITLALPAPPNCRTPGEWLDKGMLPGDRLYVNVEEGAFSETTLQRITALDHQPDGDLLFATVEP